MIISQSALLTHVVACVPHDWRRGGVVVVGVRVGMAGWTRAPSSSAAAGSAEVSVCRNIGVEI